MTTVGTIEPMPVDLTKWEEVDETTLKVDDVVMFWHGGYARRVLKVVTFSDKLGSSGFYAEVTATTRSGTVQFSLWAGQYIWRLKTPTA